MIKIDATELPRFMTCNGSRLMTPTTPVEAVPNPVRDEGNAAHYMAAAMFRNEFNLEELIDRQAPNGIYMTVDMANHISDYLDVILNRGTSLGEMELDVTICQPEFQINARADYISYNFDAQVLYIDDFKYGWRLVDVRNNWTMIAYAIGFCILKSVSPAMIVFTIHQPRPYHPDGKVRDWRINYGDLLNYWNYISATLNNPSNSLVTSMAHCATCHAIATCPAARAAEMNSIDVSDMVYEDTIDNDKLTYNLDTLYHAEAMIKARLEAFEELAKHRIKNGQVVNNFSVQQTYGHTRWKDHVTVDLLKILTGKDLSNGKLVTPAEAKRQKVSDAVIDSMTHRVPSGIKLVRGKASDKAERLFGDKKNAN